MALTMEQANVLLDYVQTEAQLRDLISQLDVTASGTIDGTQDSVKTSAIVNEMIASGA